MNKFSAQRRKDAMMRDMTVSSDRRPVPRTASNRTASQVNSTVLLDALRAGGALSRADLARRTGLSVATVNRLVERLVEDGSVTETGQESATGGRPARLLEFNAAARSVLAIDLGGRRATAAVMDLEARSLARRERALSVPMQSREAARDVFEAVAELASEMLDEARRLKSNVHTACIGVPGVVRTQSGRVDFAPALQWFDFPLVALLEERLGIPVSVENDVNLVALAELRHGVARDRADVLTISVGTGVGAALILDGRLYRGAAGAAGEAGYTMLDRSSLGSPWPGFGDLESRVGTAGILRRLGDEASDSEEFLAQVRAGDAPAVTVFDEIIDNLALVIGNASALLNPELIVLSGGFGRAAADLLIPAIERRLQGRIPFEPQIVRAELADAELIGAAEVAIDASAQSAALVD